MSFLSPRERIEVDFWRDDPDERPGAESLRNQLDKSCDALVFTEALSRLSLPDSPRARCLELGGGQGWASCVLKRLLPETHVTASDISEHAVASTPRWERIYGVELDGALACRSHELPFDDASLDFVFCFAAAHHFEKHDDALREIERVLAPSGVAAYLYEPTAPRWLYRWAHQRVNRKRPEVPEDVLVPSRMKAFADANGLECKIDYWPTTLKRSGLAAPYYAALSCVPWACRWTPCTANLIFRRVRD